MVKVLVIDRQDEVGIFRCSSGDDEAGAIRTNGEDPVRQAKFARGRAGDVLAFIVECEHRGNQPARAGYDVGG